MKLSVTINTSQYKQTSWLVQKPRENYNQRLRKSRLESNDIQVQSMSQYILRNIHSNRKKIMHLYENGVLHPRKTKSTGFPGKNRQLNHMSLVEKYLQTQYFKRQLMEKNKDKKDPTFLNKHKVVVMRKCFQTFSPSTSIRLTKTGKFQPFKERETSSVEHFRSRTIEKQKNKSNIELSISQRKKLRFRSNSIIAENIQLNPWQNHGKFGFPSQTSTTML